MAFCANITTIKLPKVMFTMQKVHFKNNTGKKGISVILENGIRYFKKWKILKPARHWMSWWETFLLCILTMTRFNIPGVPLNILTGFTDRGQFFKVSPLEHWGFWQLKVPNQWGIWQLAVPNQWGFWQLAVSNQWELWQLTVLNQWDSNS